MNKPHVLLTGADGKIGRALRERLSGRYDVIGTDRDGSGDDIACDLSDEGSVRGALAQVAGLCAGRLASVVHLAGYYDFTGREDPKYREVNEAGTRALLNGLGQADLTVEQFLYAGTMLIHEPGRPGERIDESASIRPGWAYPESKARTEEIIEEEAGRMRTLRLHLAGLYDDETAVPTLAHQVARVYEREAMSHLYAGDLSAGQSLIHMEDMLDAFEAAIDRRAEIPDGTVILVGEEEALSYDALQQRLGKLIHGEEDWRTWSVPAPLAKLGAWAQVKAEGPIPDALDQGEVPFIRPFMIDMASDHYALDTSRAQEMLGWKAEHSVGTDLPRLVAALKDDPEGWYRANKITPPVWLESAAERGEHPEEVRARAEAAYRAEFGRFRWAHWFNAGIGAWLVVSSPMIGVADMRLAWTNVALGVLLVLTGIASCSWRLPYARFAAAGIGALVMLAPLVFHPSVSAAWLQGTVLGLAAMCLALAVPPAIGLSPAARVTGPTVPAGWDYSPSDWFQRLPVIALAMVGLGFSYYLAAYQLGAIPGVWDPFFGASRGRDPALNGTEDIVTSKVSEAWPIPDAGIGALTYALEIVVGLVGSARRWRTMPWLVVLFGLMIVPLGVVSIGFIIIQPIVIGTYSTLALIGASAMLLQIPYSLDELVATYQFLRRRHAAGRPWLKVFLTGDTDAGATDLSPDDFDRPPRAMLRDMFTGGMTLPWTLAACIVIGLLLMLAPLWFPWGASPMAATYHTVGALVLVATVSALASVARLARLLNVPLALALAAAPFVVGSDWPEALFAWACAAALILLSVPRGPVDTSYGDWDRWVR